MIPKLFHQYPNADYKHIVEELRSLEHWEERRNALRWVMGIYVKN